MCPEHFSDDEPDTELDDTQEVSREEIERAYRDIYAGIPFDGPTEADLDRMAEDAGYSEFPFGTIGG